MTDETGSAGDPGRGTLWPSTDPFDRREIAVDPVHTLYLEQFGNPDGVPVVFLHGGPGSGCQRDHARLFDPQRFRVVLFDQRGAGKSKPKRELTDNTTWHLVADIERIREALGIECWMAVGGSWGSTLALAYAERHPERVLGLVLRAVFLGTRGEADWAFRDAARLFRPELWAAFRDLLPEVERADPVAAYGARLTDPDPKLHRPAAHVWSAFERILSTLRPSSDGLPKSLDERSLRASANLPNTPFLEWHYVSQDCFLEPGQLLRDADRLAGIPGIIVQGRYDMLCPPGAASDLAARWPDASLHIVADAGHAASEPGIRAALLVAIADIGDRVRGRA